MVASLFAAFEPIEDDWQAMEVSALGSEKSGLSSISLTEKNKKVESTALQNLPSLEMVKQPTPLLVKKSAEDLCHQFIQATDQREKDLYFALLKVLMPTKLHVSDSATSDGDIDRLCELQSLKILSLNSCPRLTNAIGTSLRKREFEELEFSLIPITDEIGTDLKKIKTLKKLNLSFCKISGKLGEQLVELHNLRTLIVYGAIQDADEMVDSLAKMEQLEDLAFKCILSHPAAAKLKLAPLKAKILMWN